MHSGGIANADASGGYNNLLEFQKVQRIFFFSLTDQSNVRQLHTGYETLQGLCGKCSERVENDSFYLETSEHQHAVN